VEKWLGVDLRTAINKTCKEIELQIQNLLTILDAIVNIIGGPYVIILWLGKSSLRTMNRMIIQALKTYEECGYMHDLDLLFISH
jgi:hypothetical protein